MTNQNTNRLNRDHTVSRRKFIGTTALGSAALLSGGLTSLLPRSASAAGGFDFLEKSIPELQDAMASGRLSSKGLVIEIGRASCRERVDGWVGYVSAKGHVM